MTEVAAVAAATPAPGSVTNPGGNSSPVNAASAASKANQQATAAGEVQGLTNKDQAAETSDTVTPVTQEPATLDTSGEPASLTPQTGWKPTGRKEIDQVAELLSSSNIPNVEGMLTEVLKDNELSLASKAKLVDEYGADISNIIINQLDTAVSNMKENNAAEAKRLKEYAFSKFGGDNPDVTWEGLQQFAQSEKANLSSDDRTAMNEMLAKGGVYARLVIDSLHTKYQSSGGYSNPPNLMQGDSVIQSGFKPLSKKEYQQEIGPAVVKYGETSQEVQALRNRRAISMMRGYN